MAVSSPSGLCCGPHRWVHSAASKAGEDASIAAYNGRWTVTESDGDHKLSMADANKHYGLSSMLDPPFTFNGDALVVQVRPQVHGFCALFGVLIFVLNLS